MTVETTSSPCPHELQRQLGHLKAAALEQPYPSLAKRRDRLKRAIDVLVRNEKRITETIDADFGGRPEALSLMVDVLAPVRSLKYALKHVGQWMKPDVRKTGALLKLLGARAGVFYQPLGVVGVMSPWNAPMALTFSPLSSILAAGNRAFLKPSELSPQTSALIAEMVASAFAPDEIAVATGEVEVARAFSALPFDHLVFTGGASTARHVMRAAADHLVPLTLELGGKAPCIVAKGSDLTYAATKFAQGKCINAGQVCMSPDFAYVHHDDKETFAREVKAAVARMYPQLAQSPDFTHIHLAQQRRHLLALLDDARHRGTRLDVLDGTPLDHLEHCPKFPPVLALDPPLDSALMVEEVFGPIMPIVGYHDLNEVVRTLSRHTRPLALYFIGGTREDMDFMLRHTYAGGVSFDDVQLHVMMQDYGQGGVGESGMGRYLGFDGFKSMSNCKSYAERPWLDITRFMAPPYSSKLVQTLRRIL